MNASEEFHIRNGWSKKRPESGQFLAAWIWEEETWSRTMKWEDSPVGKRLMEYNPHHEVCIEPSDEWVDVTNDTYPEALYLQLERF